MPTTPAPAAASDKVYAIESLRTLVNALDLEYEDLLFHIPTIPALIEYRALWDTYDTEFLSGIAEQIQDGDDPAPLNAFIRQYDLPWRPLADRDTDRQSARVAAFCRALIQWASHEQIATRSITPHVAEYAALIAPANDTSASAPEPTDPEDAARDADRAYRLAGEILHYHKHGRRFERATRRTLADRAVAILNGQEEPADRNH